ncbi:MAG: DNA primase large subunit PriL [Thermococci archaeon]|nr:DNA primase large subunit PriL [Thermococci archaeon]
MLDPFGGRAAEIIEEFGGLMKTLMIIPDYVDPDEVIKRVSWEDKPPDELIDMNDIEDVLGFYALLGALSIKPYGFEVEEVMKRNAEIYLHRIRLVGRFDGAAGIEAVGREDLPSRDAFILERRGLRGVTPEERENLRIAYRIHLSDFLKFWEGSLKDVYVRSGYAYLSKPQALEVWRGYFRRRFSEVLRSIEGLESEFYKGLNEKMGELIRKRAGSTLYTGSVKAQPLRFDLFPPCVRMALEGVPSGMRNYAITVLLTSFLSYARFCPNPSRKDVRLRDCVQSVREVEEEVVSVVIDAGNRCSPPLFEDQPNEIKNVWYHLGFGFTEKPSLDDSGSSVWYFPPNCDKIRANVPQLCNPDEFCRGIRNPLTYYLRRLFREKQRQGGDGAGTGAEGGGDG